ncbi:hypothetical protein DFH09DRAFT_1070679 [Mycena vulgaris]|nr:hypothetical protein DFH09DRAFT_1070679 [Mycena vulgaris]
MDVGPMARVGGYFGCAQGLGTGARTSLHSKILGDFMQGETHFAALKNTWLSRKYLVGVYAVWWNELLADVVVWTKLIRNQAERLHRGQVQWRVTEQCVDAELGRCVDGSARGYELGAVIERCTECDEPRKGVDAVPRGRADEGCGFGRVAR